MELKLYPRLNLRSKRAILKVKKQFGNPYNYNPWMALLKRLSAETGMSVEEVRNQLFKERRWLIENRQYYL